ncbi:MAG TPA: Sir2 family NAD-dependent protein deacetylase, partial [Woeseiaceae bacterium]|nr:Sir2 family NAD-dependent protein deacetylase [Woeseiaceae bacterium]
MTTVDLLGRFLRKHRKLMVLSGAGCSTDSGIPDYRDEDGNWKHSRPVQFGDFLRDAGTRRYYWARSFAGWQRISRA